MGAFIQKIIFLSQYILKKRRTFIDERLYWLILTTNVNLPCRLNFFLLKYIIMTSNSTPNTGPTLFGGKSKLLAVIGDEVS
jgi:hypothetical protein